LRSCAGWSPGAIRAPEDEPPRGAGPAELDNLQAMLGCGIPSVLRAWLSVCRGAAIGPGGVFGPRPDAPSLDMAWRRDLFTGGGSGLPWAGIPAFSAVSTDHGRRARRTIKAALASAWIEFAGAAQVAQLRRTVTTKGKKTVEVVYLITSDSDAGPAALAAWIRGHWEIENKLHWSAVSPIRRISPWSEQETRRG